MGSFSPTADAAQTQPSGSEDAAARNAVLALTGDRPEQTVVPADFATMQGYHPVRLAGMTVDPSGQCSSPIPLPAEFDTPCKAHDLGYDLLRYAEHRGHPLGAWARQAIDNTLEHRMFQACTMRSDLPARLRCQVMATVATVAVDLNSRRQNYSAPMPEYLFGAQLSGTDLGPQLMHVLAPVAMVLVMVAALFVIVRRTIRRPVTTGDRLRLEWSLLTAHRLVNFLRERSASAGVAGERLRVTARRFVARPRRRAGSVGVAVVRRVGGFGPPRIGTVMATAIGVSASLAPGLLPRTSVAQALLTTVLVLIALTVAGLGRKILRRFGIDVDRRWDRYRFPIAAVSGAGVLAALGYAWYWQNRLRSAMDFPPVGLAYWLHCAIGVAAVTIPVLLVMRGLRWATGYVGRLRSAAVVTVTALACQFALVPALVDWQRSAFAAADAAVDPTVVQPVSYTRSGSPDSVVSWASLGAEGRKFVSERGGSVRVYIGLESAPDLNSRVALAIRELERSGSLHRGHIVMMVPTGSGWIDAKAAHGLDQRFGGDATLIGMQYSQAPSWATFLFARAQAEQSARALFRGLERRLSTMAHPPKLYVYGQSLGATAGSAIFADHAERGRVCAVLWAGPPAAATHREGATVLANSSDPVVQWSPQLLWRAPDLTGTRPDAPHPPWLPVVSWVQTTADMLSALAPGPGHGHRYGVDQGTALRDC